MITPDVETRMRAALAQVEGEAERAEEAAPGVVSNAWAWMIGADSTAAGARNVARAARADADRFRARFDALVSSATATDAEGERFIADAAASYNGGSGSRIVQEEASRLTPAAAISETAAGTWHDIKSAAPKVGIGLGIVVFAVAALLVRDAVRKK